MLGDVRNITLHRGHMTIGLSKRPRPQFRPRLRNPEEASEYEAYNLWTIQCCNRGIDEHTYQVSDDNIYCYIIF